MITGPATASLTNRQDDQMDRFSDHRKIAGAGNSPPTASISDTENEMEELSLSDHHDISGDPSPVASVTEDATEELSLSNQQDFSGTVTGDSSPASSTTVTDYYSSSSSSFTDIIFTPPPSSPTPAGDDAGDYLRIDVSDPQSHRDVGSTAYVTYLITTRTLGSGSAEFGVRRRFRDVIALADRLAESYRGFFVPQRPEKSAVEGRMMMEDEEFLEWRRSEVEKYLRRLAAHPIIGKGEELRVFLLSFGYLPFPATSTRVFDGALRLPRPIFGETAGGVQNFASQDVSWVTAKGGRNLMRVWKELKQVVVNEFGGESEFVMEEDEEFLERKETIEDFELKLVEASVKAEAIVKAQQDIGETMEDLGLALFKLTQLENNNATYYSQIICAADSKHVASAATETSGLYRELNTETVKYMDTLHEYLELMLAVNIAFSERASALLSVQTLMSDLSSLQMKKEKLEASSPRKFDSSRIEKLGEIREKIRVTEEAKHCALKDYEKIKENNRYELEKLDNERHEDFLCMLKGFALSQRIYAEKIANIWVTVAEEMSGYELD